MEEAINPFAKSEDSKSETEAESTFTIGAVEVVEYIPMDKVLQHIKLNLKSCGTNKAEQDRAYKSIETFLVQFSQYRK